ncbi:putative monogalactosyldiacylglycerol synthase 2, chloroplastic [Porphyridium purpureum]|uniref:Putative monogalactosyldiacylglycerol synthase 2, chloroplastic n=1 Tax=Porphyridium purpureum TaxID=35688 RepID=A0A5J4YMC4_PORPP|nr:putative monogalactosyldiacylglycerol synthase 2, chloroplastic [Porphyridium purpureum]|eukprot:POR9461..scf295_9
MSRAWRSLLAHMATTHGVTEASEIGKHTVNVALMYGTGGGGHRASAEAVKCLLQQKHAEWRIELHDASAIIGASFGDDLYNALLQSNLTSVMPVVYSVASSVHPYLAPAHRNAVKAYFKNIGVQPDIVVSMVPFSNRAFVEALPFAEHVTIMTDLTHSDAHPWIQHEKQFIVCGTEQAYKQAVALGMPETQLFRASGMVVHPKFYIQPAPSRAHALIESFGLQPGLQTVLVLFGAYPPSSVMKQICTILSDREQRLQHPHLPREALDMLGWTEPVNQIIVCGKNEQLKRQLEASVNQHNETGISRAHIVGFTSHIYDLMHVSDLVIGKPGPGVVSEALVCGKPVLLYAGHSAHYVMEQERTVLNMVCTRGFGRASHDVHELVSFSADEITGYHQNIMAERPNRAVYEATEVISSRLHAKATSPDSASIG